MLKTFWGGKSCKKYQLKQLLTQKEGFHKEEALYIYLKEHRKLKEAKFKGLGIIKPRIVCRIDRLNR
jgi:hypothetical protein